MLPNFSESDITPSAPQQVDDEKPAPLPAHAPPPEPPKPDFRVRVFVPRGGFEVL